IPAGMATGAAAFWAWAMARAASDTDTARVHVRAIRISVSSPRWCAIRGSVDIRLPENRQLDSLTNGQAWLMQDQTVAAAPQIAHDITVWRPRLGCAEPGPPIRQSVG